MGDVLWCLLGIALIVVGVKTGWDAHKQPDSDLYVDMNLTAGSVMCCIAGLIMLGTLCLG